MRYVTASMTGMTRLTFLDDMYKAGTVMLFGGAPTIKDLPLDRLREKGVISAAINNAAVHFRPQLWFSGDNPQCYAQEILRDAAIMKFAPQWHMETQVSGRPYKTYPNMVFYIPDRSIPISDMLTPNKNTPWLGNTLSTAIAVLYFVGFRKIILCGCDFEPAADGSMYAHPDTLTDQEKRANLRLYQHQVEFLISLKPVLKSAGLTLMDCSSKTKLAEHYETMTFDAAVDFCLKDQAGPCDTARLPHGTEFASDEIRKKVGVLPPVQINAL